MQVHSFHKYMGAALCAALLAVSCGGGGGTPAATPAVSLGTVTGFGSVIVNGTHFDDSQATVLIDELPGTSAQLKVGMVVAVEGSGVNCPSSDTALCSGVASRIRFRNNLVGPITSVNLLTNTIQVMGRDVVIGDSSMLTGMSPRDLSGLQVNDVVQVSGLLDRDQVHDRIRARLLDKTGTLLNGTSALSVMGTVSNANLSGATCTVDGVNVQFSGLASGSLPSGGIANGQYVQVTGSTFAGGLLTADRIQLRDRISFPSATRIEVEGAITQFVTLSNFLVNGQAVDASSAVFRNGTASDLANGVLVDVIGTMSGSTLLASKVTLRLEANVEVAAPLQAVDPVAGTLQLLGRSIGTTTATQYVDTSSGTGRPLRTLGLSNLVPGDRIDVRAYKDASGNLVATRVERTDPDTRLTAKGPVDAKVPNSGLTIVGIAAVTGAQTNYTLADGTSTTDATFYATVQVPPALPSLVRVMGVASATLTNTIDATHPTGVPGEARIAQ